MFDAFDWGNQHNLLRLGLRLAQLILAAVTFALVVAGFKTQTAMYYSPTYSTARTLHVMLASHTTNYSMLVSFLGWIYPLFLLWALLMGAALPVFTLLMDAALVVLLLIAGVLLVISSFTRDCSAFAPWTIRCGNWRGASILLFVTAALYLASFLWRWLVPEDADKNPTTTTSQTGRTSNTGTGSEYRQGATPSTTHRTTHDDDDDYHPGSKV